VKKRTKRRLKRKVRFSRKKRTEELPDEKNKRWVKEEGFVG